MDVCADVLGLRHALRDNCAHLRHRHELARYRRRKLHWRGRSCGLGRLIARLWRRLIAGLRWLISRRLHGSRSPSTSAMLLQEAEDVVFGNASAKAGAGELAQIDVVV